MPLLLVDRDDAHLRARERDEEPPARAIDQSKYAFHTRRFYKQEGGLASA